MIPLNTIYKMDCLEGMKLLDDKSVDMILCDLPYGTTACEWDKVLPLDKLWLEYKRIIKENGAIVLTSSFPFTIDLINSNREWFRYIWHWKKEQGTGFANANKMPLKIFEECCVFYKNLPYYKPPKTRLPKPRTVKRKDNTSSDSSRMTSKEYINKKVSYDHETPINFLCFNRERGLHPTQKPVKLFRYLIKTYTREGELILDNCMGSGTTAWACKSSNRNFIGFEINKEYCDMTKSRLLQHTLIPKKMEVEKK